MIESEKKINPKQLHKYFSKRNTTHIPFDDLYMHFKNLSENSLFHEYDSFESELLDIEQPIFEAIDFDIFIEEIREFIIFFKKNKRCNKDYMLNEIFIDCGETIIPVLSKRFSATCIFFLRLGQKKTIVPVFKKGNVNDTNKTNHPLSSNSHPSATEK